MAAEHSSNSKLEVAHVLFVDIVGYSQLLIDEQSAIAAQLNNIVRGTEHFRAAEANDKLISLPTGDGMALAFFNSPEAPVQCAVEIAKNWRGHEQSRVRMAIHSGPVELVTDVNGRKNIAGTGFNVAQRLVHCADADHILLSNRVAEDLDQYERWRPHLHPIGEMELKHGKKISVVNLYGEEFGNSQMPVCMTSAAGKHEGKTFALRAFAAASCCWPGLVDSSARTNALAAGRVAFYPGEKCGGAAV